MACFTQTGIQSRQPTTSHRRSGSLPHIPIIISYELKKMCFQSFINLINNQVLFHSKTAKAGIHVLCISLGVACLDRTHSPRLATELHQILIQLRACKGLKTWWRQFHYLAITDPSRDETSKISDLSQRDHLQVGLPQERSRPIHYFRAGRGLRSHSFGCTFSGFALKAVSDTDSQPHGDARFTAVAFLTSYCFNAH